MTDRILYKRFCICMVRRDFGTFKSLQDYLWPMWYVNKMLCLDPTKEDLYYSLFGAYNVLLWNEKRFPTAYIICITLWKGFIEIFLEISSFSHLYFFPIRYCDNFAVSFLVNQRSCWPIDQWGSLILKSYRRWTLLSITPCHLFPSTVILMNWKRGTIKYEIEDFFLTLHYEYVNKLSWEYLCTKSRGFGFGSFKHWKKKLI